MPSGQLPERIKKARICNHANHMQKDKRERERERDRERNKEREGGREGARKGGGG